MARGVRTRPWALEICSPGLVPPPSAAHTQHWGGVEFTRYTCEVDGQQARTPPTAHASTQCSRDVSRTRSTDWRGTGEANQRTK